MSTDVGVKPLTPHSSTFPFGEGGILCDPGDGAIVRISHPRHPDMNFLLGDPEQAWHHSPFYWGKGFLVTSLGAGRWDHPERLTLRPDGYDLFFRPMPGLDLAVARRVGHVCRETYSLRNVGSAPVRIGSWGISTPFRDVYPNARECLASACHAHLWPGGERAYVWAIRMNGQGPGLGLAVEQGALWSYSIETRNIKTGSNARGHIYLHVTDAARSPGALGGQPELILAPGERYELAWTLGWYETFEEFESAKSLRPFILSACSARVGEPIDIRSDGPMALGVTALEPGHGGAAVRLGRSSETLWRVTSHQAGIAHLEIRIDGRTHRAAVLFHRPLRDIVEARVAYILSRHRAADRAPDRRGAFLPVDTRTQLRVLGGNWNDWSDARERMAMPILLQYALRRGWGSQAAMEEALEDFCRYARTHLMDEQGTVYEDSFHRDPRRLYNFPWLAWFFWSHYRLHGRKTDLSAAATILNRYYELGGAHFLAFIGEWAGGLVDSLEKAGESATAQGIRERILAHAEYFLGLGQDLPKHEVNYEQTVVAPLVMLMALAYRWKPTEELASALAERLRWLLAFAGRQPHARLRDIAIRHWDGYWFGAYRQWGDIFPHYWTVQTAAALLLWPEAIQPAPPRSDRESRASTILKANLAHFHDHGSATCAFVFPGCVDGNPGYHEDPMANDQDWALVYYLHLLESGCLSDDSCPSVEPGHTENRV